MGEALRVACDGAMRLLDASILETGWGMVVELRRMERLDREG